MASTHAVWVVLGLVLTLAKGTAPVPSQVEGKEKLEFSHPRKEDLFEPTFFLLQARVVSIFLIFPSLTF